MPSRNDPCPCGSGRKYKRCCLIRLDEVARQQRERDELMDQVVGWLRAEHENVVHAAGDQTRLISLLGGPAGRNMSLTWALSDYRPEDGGSPLMARYARQLGLNSSARAIAESLAGARLTVYRVGAVVQGLWVEIDPLSDGAKMRLACRDGLDQLRTGELLLARIVEETALPTIWGMARRFPGSTERKWQARLQSLPAERAAAGLVLLSFDPDDAAEPLPDGIELHRQTWSIGDDEEVIEAIEEEDLWECIGQSIPSGWAFAWPEEQESDGIDLGGWNEYPSEIEIARLIIDRQLMTLITADRDTLRECAHHVEISLGRLISSPPDILAA